MNSGSKEGGEGLVEVQSKYEASASPSNVESRLVTLGIGSYSGKQYWDIHNRFSRNGS